MNETHGIHSFRAFDPIDFNILGSTDVISFLYVIVFQGCLISTHTCVVDDKPWWWGAMGGPATD